MAADDVPTETGSRNYFVDEAGDGDLFDRKGRVIIGEPGCSRFFMLGVLDVADPGGLAEALQALRLTLLSDPYFKGVPSMQPEAKKTAVGFHATDDPPEVRREVIGLLAQSHVRFQVVVKRKQSVLEYVRSRNRVSAGYRYNPNELYEYMVRRLFRNLLHKDSRYNVCFATRGKSDRTAALRQALDSARVRFQEKHSINTQAPVQVWPCPSSRCGCLQAADYFLWALQRLYEKREERYLGVLWPRFRLVVDVDDTRATQYGVYYTQKRPLSLAALDNGQGI